ncbi:MAG: hypothetical protein L6V93_17125 [Clostridiales bacterium]|nr:MAG: hypothetical protein L6V93_17125 [Clostridiales bacterium]
MTALISIDRKSEPASEKNKGIFLSLTEIIDYEVSISENHIIKMLCGQYEIRACHIG